MVAIKLCIDRSQVYAGCQLCSLERGHFSNEKEAQNRSLAHKRLKNLNNLCFVDMG